MTRRTPKGRPLGDWTGTGLDRADGKGFAKAEAGKEQFLMAPAGRNGCRVWSARVSLSR